MDHPRSSISRSYLVSPRPYTSHLSKNLSTAPKALRVSGPRIHVASTRSRPRSHLPEADPDRRADGFASPPAASCQYAAASHLGRSYSAAGHYRKTTESTEAYVHRLFKSLDTDGDGVLTKAELSAGFRGAPPASPPAGGAGRGVAESDPSSPVKADLRLRWVLPSSRASPYRQGFGSGAYVKGLLERGAQAAPIRSTSFGTASRLASPPMVLQAQA